MARILRGLSQPDRRAVGYLIAVQTLLAVEGAAEDGWLPTELADVLRRDDAAETLPLLHFYLQCSSTARAAEEESTWLAALEELPPAAPVAIDDVYGLANHLRITAALDTLLQLSGVREGPATTCA